MITGHLEVVKSAELVASYLAMMGVLGLSTLSARANGKLGMTTVIEAGKMICYCCHALLSQVCEIIDVMVIGKEGLVNHCSEFVFSQSDSIVQKINRLTDR